MFPLKDENPPKRKPIVTYTLIIINTAIFIGTLLNNTFDQTIVEFGMRPNVILAGQRPHTLITSMFLHGGVFHILFNMWYLWIFGDNVEDALGKGKFILFYLAAGLIASFVHILSDPTSHVLTIGASGAISGVLGAYVVLYPWTDVHTLVVFVFIRLVTIPALLFVGFWFVLQLLSASLTWLSGVSAGIAYWAHIGGFIAGALLILPAWLKRRSRERRRYSYDLEYA